MQAAVTSAEDTAIKDVTWIKILEVSGAVEARLPFSWAFVAMSSAINGFFPSHKLKETKLKFNIKLHSTRLLLNATGTVRNFLKYTFIN